MPIVRTSSLVNVLVAVAVIAAWLGLFAYHVQEHQQAATTVTALSQRLTALDHRQVVAEHRAVSDALYSIEAVRDRRASHRLTALEQHYATRLEAERVELEHQLDASKGK